MVIQTPIRGLRSFCIAAKCLSFKHAASQLYLTPSAVSHQIKLLEQYLGFQLFVRKTRSIELTHQGEQFYHALQPQLLGLAQTIETFKLKQRNKVIVIAMPEFFASELFIPKLIQWTRHNPTIDIQVETAKTGQNKDRAADLSIVLTSGKPSDGIVEQLFPIRYVPACNQKLYQQYAHLSHEQLQTLPLILHKSRPWSWHQWAQNVGVDQFDSSQIIQLDSMYAVVRAAQQGMGVALVPLPISKAWFDERLLVKLFTDELVIKDRYYLVQHHNDDQTKPIERFAHWVKNEFQGLK
jgi:LysR family glycine cleavage system transcriptional activator